MKHRLVAVAVGITAGITMISSAPAAQVDLQPSAAAPRVPTALLYRAGPITLRGEVDSNSPAVWDLENGQEVLHVVTSAGRPSVEIGTSLQTLGPAHESNLAPWPTGANWMEAIVKDSQGTWYGYYHNERNAADICPGTALGSVQIGAARSTDHGQTWEDLGIILDAPPRTEACNTSNAFFVDGVGDFSVQLDGDQNDLYIFFSSYPRQLELQGVGVARLRWADRDNPAGKANMWSDGIWRRARPLLRRATADIDTAETLRWFYPAAMPFYPAVQTWHDPSTMVVDAFWGPSIHWNTYLQQYVMLLSRAKDAGYGVEGIYVSFAPRLDDPRLWSTPRKIFDGGDWYPQVIGLEPGTGTDKVAGQTARFFMKGTSIRSISFSK